MASFGRELRRLRLARKLTMSQLAEQAGVSERSLRNWEQGRHEPGTAELLLVFQTLAVDAEAQVQLVARLCSPRFQAPNFHCPYGQLPQLQTSPGTLARLEPVSPDPPIPNGAFVIPPHSGDLLRALRCRKGLTRAEIVSTLGIQPATLARWEQGTRYPAEEQLERLTALLGARPEECQALWRRRLHSREVYPPELEALAAQVDHFVWYQAAPTYRGGDFAALSLLATLWPRVRFSSFARRLLLRTAASYALSLTYQHRLEEARRYSELATSLLLDRNGEPPDVLSWVAVLYSRCTIQSPTEDPKQLGKGLVSLQTWLPHTESPSVRCYLQGRSSQYACRLGWWEAARALLMDAEQAHRQLLEGSEDWHDRSPLLANVRWQLRVVGSGYRRGWDEFPALVASTHFSAAANLHLAGARMHLAGGSRHEAQEHLALTFEIIDAHRFDILRRQAEHLAAQL